LIGQWKFLYWEIIGGLNLWNSKLSTAGLSKKILIVFFLSAILLLWPYTASSIYAVQPSDPNKDIGKPDTSSNQSTNNEKENQGRNYKKLLEIYPDTTPMQEKIKQAIQVMKEGDPKKPKENNGKRNPQNIPELVIEVLSKEEIKKDGNVVGKKIKTKTTLIFSNPGQSLFSENDWEKIGFDKNFIFSSDSDGFEEMCAKTKGKVTEDGQFCDLNDTFKNKINSKLSELNQNWDLDDESFYIIEGDVDFEKVKNQAKKKFKDKPKLTNGNEKNFIQVDGNYFKTNSNPFGLDTKQHQKKIEFIEEYEVDFSDDYERSLGDSTGQSQIIPSSYTSEPLVQEDSFWSNDLPGDFSSMILPEAHGLGDQVGLAMMGFTVAPPSFHYSLVFKQSICFPIWYPTGVHVVWPSHWHIHTAHKNICVEIFFFKIFADAEFRAGLRLPVEVRLKNVPASIFPGTPLTLNLTVSGLDFNRQNYTDFCESDNNTIKSDPILSLASMFGQDPCVNFAFESSLTPPEEKPEVIDGDEFALKFLLQAGIEFKLLDRSFDVCAEVIEPAGFPCVLGWDIDLGRDMTATKISALHRFIPDNPISQNQLEDIKDKQGVDVWLDTLKEHELSVSTFQTPVGSGMDTPFGISLKIPARCDMKPLNFPEADCKDPIKTAGPFTEPECVDKKDNQTLVACKEPSANCLCTGFILKEQKVDIPKDSGNEISLSLGIGLEVGLELLGGSVKSKLSVTGDNSAANMDDLVFGRDLSMNNNPGPWDVTELVHINGTDVDPNSDFIKIQLNNFKYNLNAFAVTADPVIDLGGTIVDKLTELTGIDPDVTIPFFRFAVTNAPVGIDIPQHARTGPVTFLIPVDYFGMTIPPDVVSEATGNLTNVTIGEPIIDPMQSGNVTFDRNATNPQLFELGNHTVFYNATNNSTSDDIKTRDFVQSIIVQDTTAPNMTLPNDIGIEAVGPLTLVNIGNATATDLIDPSPEISNDAPDNSTFQVGIRQIITWNATDSFGNTALEEQVVNVTDTTPPTITIPDNRVGNASIGIDGFNSLVEIGLASATDIADANVAISIDELDEQEVFVCESIGFVPDDNDGVPEMDDNCPGVKNTNQTDTDDDDIGDVCDLDDIDGDGFFGFDNSTGTPRPLDNCEYVFNPSQNNTNAEVEAMEEEKNNNEIWISFGDACDDNSDGVDNDMDGRIDEDDERDTDHDGVKDEGLLRFYQMLHFLTASDL